MGLWRPDVVTMTGPIYAGQFAIDNHTAAALGVIGCLPLPEFFDNKVQTILDVQLRYAVADVIRRRWYPKMRVQIDGRAPEAPTQKLIRANGLVLSKLLDIVSEVFLFDPCGYAHPAYWWLDNCLEIGAHRLAVLADSNKTGASKALLKSTYDASTAALRRFENPFEGDFSRPLFDRAVKMAAATVLHNYSDDSDLFHPAKFLPYLAARSKLSALAREKKLKLIK